MKKSSLGIFIFFVALFSCARETNISPVNGVSISEEAKSYWYNGTAEITSFKIQQARYGEIREGYAVMIFVTEDFSTDEFTKADKSKKKTIPVLKLNFTKNFITGIYPYSLMTSSFVPFENFDHVLKITTSVQEWCGHVFMEMLRDKKMHYNISSYFEDENAKDEHLEIAWAEDEIWSMIRLYPESIPTGMQQMVPSFTYLRLLHQEMKTYECEIKNEKLDSVHNKLSMNYPDLDREVEITYESAFPRKIIGWSETYPDGFGDTKKVLTSTGTKIKTIRSDYWTKNKSVDQSMRKELGLE